MNLSTVGYREDIGRTKAGKGAGPQRTDVGRVQGLEPGLLSALGWKNLRTAGISLPVPSWVVLPEEGAPGGRVLAQIVPCL